jgi:hypothetical protein
LVAALSSVHAPSTGYGTPFGSIACESISGVRRVGGLRVGVLSAAGGQPRELRVRMVGESCLRLAAS